MHVPTHVQTEVTPLFSSDRSFGLLVLWEKFMKLADKIALVIRRGKAGGRDTPCAGSSRDTRQQKWASTAG